MTTTGNVLKEVQNRSTDRILIVERDQSQQLSVLRYCACVSQPSKGRIEEIFKRGSDRGNIQARVGSRKYSSEGRMDEILSEVRMEEIFKQGSDRGNIRRGSDGGNIQARVGSRKY